MLMNDQNKVFFVVVDEAHDGQRIDNFLTTLLKGVPKSHLYRIVRSGEVRVNKGRVEVSHRLVCGDRVRIPPVKVAERVNLGGSSEGRAAGRVPLPVLFEDDALIALDKPSGLAVHGGSGVSFGVIEALRLQRPEARFLELVHRLDRETSGVLLVAKKRSCLTAMHALLRGEEGAKGIEKHYWVLVSGAWPDERRHVRLRLKKFLTDSGERRVSVDEAEGQEAHSLFSRVEGFRQATLLDCHLYTGRTHQIRVHLAHLGFPIVGDDKYGDFALNKQVQANRNGGLKRMFLHARSLRFCHPLSGEPLLIESPLSADLQAFIGFLRGR